MPENKNIMIYLLKNIYVKRFLYYVPFACLTAMTVPSVFFSTANILSAVIGFAVAMVLGLFRANLPLTATLACVAVYVTDRIMDLAG